jgi:hypothetical protein
MITFNSKGSTQLLTAMNIEGMAVASATLCHTELRAVLGRWSEKRCDMPSRIMEGLPFIGKCRVCRFTLQKTELSVTTENKPDWRTLFDE